MNATTLSKERFGTWTTPRNTLSIEYSLPAIEQIGELAIEGREKLARTGAEIGGVLYGTREEKRIRILAMRPLVCEYANGPTFTLSDRDRLKLQDLLQVMDREPELAKLVPLGFFVSHAAGDLALTPNDLFLYDEYFPEWWQLALVVRPDKSGAVDAGFFVREKDGTVRTTKSYREFRIEPQTVPVKPEREAVDASRIFRRAPAESVTALRHGPAISGFPAERRPRRSRQWVWLLLWAAAVVGGIAAFRSYALPAASAGLAAPIESLNLRLSEKGGQMHLDWDRTTHALTSSPRATVQITDGSENKTLNLDQNQLAHGSLNYSRRTSDVSMQMTVYPVNQTPVTELTRFLGPAPSPVVKDVDEMANIRNERDGAMEEIERLHRKMARQAERVESLEKTVQILQNRVEVDRARYGTPKP